MALGSYYDTKVIIDTSLSMHTQKINEALSSSLEMFEKIAVSLKTLSFASNSKNF